MSANCGTCADSGYVMGDGGGESECTECVSVLLDGKAARVPKNWRSASILFGAAERDSTYQCFLEGKPNECDRLITPLTELAGDLRLRDGMSFYFIPSATYA